MLARSIIKHLSKEERSYVRDGALFTSLLTGAFGYYHYREYIKKDFLRSHAHYKFNL